MTVHHTASRGPETLRAGSFRGRVISSMDVLLSPPQISSVGVGHKVTACQTDEDETCLITSNGEIGLRFVIFIMTSERCAARNLTISRDW